MNKRITLKKSTQKTVALVARIYVGELPYVTSWINYYTSLGIHKIYLIITNAAEASQIKKYIQDAITPTAKIDFFVSSIRTIQMSTYNSIISSIKEDYTLFLDIDEYLDIGSNATFGDFLKSEPGEKYHFYWVITTNDGISNPAKGFDNKFSKRAYKTMCKTSLIAGWKDSHNFLTKVPIAPTFSKYNVIHFFGRTFNDMLIKSFYGKGYLNKDKNASLKDLETTIHSENINALPTRLKMMALISRVRKSITINKKIANHLDFDLTLETALLDELLQAHQLSSIYRKYSQFRKNMDYTTHIKPYFISGLSGIRFADLKVVNNL